MKLIVRMFTLSPNIQLKHRKPLWGGLKSQKFSHSERSEESRIVCRTGFFTSFEMTFFELFGLLRQRQFDKVVS